MKNKQLDRYVTKLKALCGNDFDDYIFHKFILKDLEKTVKKILKRKRCEYDLEYIYKQLNSYERVNFMCYTLSTNLNIFEGWYLLLLKISMYEEDIVEHSRATDIFNLYEEQFKKKKENCKHITLSILNQKELNLLKSVIYFVKGKYPGDIQYVIVKRRSIYSPFCTVVITFLDHRTRKIKSSSDRSTIWHKEDYPHLELNKKYTLDDLTKLGLFLY